MNKEQTPMEQLIDKINLYEQTGGINMLTLKAVLQSYLKLEKEFLKNKDDDWKECIKKEVILAFNNGTFAKEELEGAAEYFLDKVKDKYNIEIKHNRPIID
jgi:hypothetical protein